jgi:hypothetical protein
MSNPIDQFNTDEVTHPHMATRLLRAVLAKSFIEIALVCLVATLAAFSNFSPLLRGAIDVADGTHIAGWAHDPRAPEEAVEVQLFIDDQFVATRRATEARADLVRAGATRHPDHGFTFPLTELRLSPGVHSAQVYAVRNSGTEHKVLLPLARTQATFNIARD